MVNLWGSGKVFQMTAWSTEAWNKVSPGHVLTGSLNGAGMHVGTNDASRKQGWETLQSRHAPHLHSVLPRTIPFSTARGNNSGCLYSTVSYTQDAAQSTLYRTREVLTTPL